MAPRKQSGSSSWECSRIGAVRRRPLPPATPGRFSIRPFAEDLAGRFQSINEQWIVEMFSLEAGDRALLESPAESILEPGGRIWFVEHQELGVIGTCALVKRGQGIFELTKMGVLESARGLKAGEYLLEFVLGEALEMQLDTMFLLTSTKCAAAIHLYRKFGFEDDAEIMQRYAASYERCNVAMRWRGLTTS